MRNTYTTAAHTYDTVGNPHLLYALGQCTVRHTKLQVLGGEEVLRLPPKTEELVEGERRGGMWGQVVDGWRRGRMLGGAVAMRWLRCPSCSRCLQPCLGPSVGFVGGIQEALGLLVLTDAPTAESVPLRPRPPPPPPPPQWC